MKKSAFYTALAGSVRFRSRRLAAAMLGWLFFCVSVICIYLIRNNTQSETDAFSGNNYRTAEIMAKVPPESQYTPNVCSSAGLVISNSGKKYTAGESAKAAVLLNADTCEVLYSKNADTPLPMASTTKIMTALVVLENCNLSENVTVGSEACGVEGSSIYLVPNENITVQDLLYGLLLESGNDAAEALAIHCCKSIPAFVDKMNDKAKKMGLIRTHFDNPHGLSSENHYTTAYELSLITRTAMKNEVFRSIVSTVSYNSSKDGIIMHRFVNHNKLLLTYPGTVGVKTGYTIASGRCLVSCAENGNGEYIAVTLNDRNDWRDHKALFDYAFSSFDCVHAANAGDISFRFPEAVYSNPEDIYVSLAKGTDNYSLSVTLYR